jgi:Tfp pilus assembly protein PilF
VSPDERVTKDLDVAKFYSSHGNYEAAYLRSKDAITVMPDDAESHFRLAQAAQKLKKNDEAITEYNLYLKLDPGGDWSKDAQEALSDLQKGG